MASTNPLRKYLSDNELTQDAFAAMFDPPISQGLVHQWLNYLDGETKHATRITPERSVEIERVSKGAVPRHVTCKLFSPPAKSVPGRAAA